MRRVFMSNKKVPSQSYDPIIPRNRFRTDPIVPAASHYVAIQRVAQADGAQALSAFCEDAINVYEKHDMDTTSIWILNRKMVDFCSELLDVYEKHQMAVDIEWNR